MKDKAKEILKEGYKDDYLFDFRNKEVDINYQEMLNYIVAKMVKYAREMCELQKQECADKGYQCGNQTGVEIEQYILESKNVCDDL